MAKPTARHAVIAGRKVYPQTTLLPRVVLKFALAKLKSELGKYLNFHTITNGRE